jgi:hypothetical protein
LTGETAKGYSGQAGILLGSNKMQISQKGRVGKVHQWHQKKNRKPNWDYPNGPFLCILGAEKSIFS